MGVHIIKMPDIGEGIAEVELVGWHVKVGDTIAEDQSVADVMTDKAAVEIPSPVAGRVLALYGEVGAMMAVGSDLIHIEVEGEEGASDQTPDVQERQSEELAAKPPSEPNVSVTDTGGLSRISQSGRAKNSYATINDEHQTDGSPMASPAVRQRSSNLGISLQSLEGSGPNGRILHEDLDAFMQRAKGGEKRVLSHAYAARTGTQDIPVIGLRRKIAERMQEAKRRIPHFTYVEEVDVTELEALRVKLNSQHGYARGKLTMIPFIARAMVIALQEFPQINARFDDNKGVVTRYEGVHLGIAAQTDGGLLVPVLRHAESRDLWGNAAEIGRLAESARAGKIVRDELTGSTITITSLGALGGIVSTPVINYPEVAIVGVNRMVEKPVVLNGQIVVRKTMNLSSSFDHRVVDGMDAARFIQAVRGLLETPAMLFVD